MPNKARERFHLEALQRALCNVPSGTPLEPEPPDFVFVNDKHRLGIELTTFHLPPRDGEPPHQEWQSLKDQIVGRAERLYAEAGGSALYVGVFFHQRQRLHKKDVQLFARELADVLLTCAVPQRLDDPAITIPWERRPTWAVDIQVHGSVNGVDKLWHADAGGWVAGITSEHVSQVVRAKASRAPLARTQCEELWLVLVNDNFSRAAQAEISTEALMASYEGPFHRLIWLLPHVPRAIDLQVAQQVA
jgi:hypothetical protein